MRTKKHYVFHCNRWLATSEDDGEIVRELPAEGDDIKKPEPCESSANYLSCPLIADWMAIFVLSLLF